MFGGIAAVGSDRFLFATVDGEVLTFHVESGAVVGEFSRSSVGPAEVHVSAVAVDTDGSYLLADLTNRCVRRFSPAGLPLDRLGRRATPGMAEDQEGVFEEPSALLPLGAEVLVGCGGLGVRYGIQGGGGRFAGGADGWQRVQGLARVEDQVWVAETEAGLVHAFHRDGRVLWRTGVEKGLPFRMEFDGYGGVLILFAPQVEEQQAELGVGRLALEDGAFSDWVVEAGEDPGRVCCPFDLAVLPDGRFCVADLPNGTPPDVRVQLFSPDGRYLKTYFEDRVDLNARLRAWFVGLTAGESAPPYQRARIQHHFSGGTEAVLEKARGLYREALQADPDHLLARLALASLLDPPDAEEEYRTALDAAPRAIRGDIAARIAESREATGDYDAAIEVLENALQGADPPEEYHRYLELLGTWYLRRAGESQ